MWLFRRCLGDDGGVRPAENLAGLRKSVSKEIPNLGWEWSFAALYQCNCRWNVIKKRESEKKKRRNFDCFFMVTILRTEMPKTRGHSIRNQFFFSVIL
jgi:hypothetical protein